MSVILQCDGCGAMSGVHPDHPPGWIGAAHVSDVPPIYGRIVGVPPRRWLDLCPRCSKSMPPFVVRPKDYWPLNAIFRVVVALVTLWQVHRLLLFIEGITP